MATVKPMSAAEFNELTSQLLGSIDVQKAIDIADKYAFEGFDPKMIAAILKSKEPNAKQFQEDLKELLIIYVSRGTKTTSIVDRTKIQNKQEMSKLFTKYTVALTAKNMSKQTITLGRIASTFPMVAARLMHIDGVGRVVGTAQSKLPKGYHFAAAASIVPNELYDVWLQWAYSFDEVVNSTEGRKPDPIKVKYYADVARTQNPMSEDVKKTFMNKLG